MDRNLDNDFDDTAELVWHNGGHRLTGNLVSNKMKEEFQELEFTLNVSDSDSLISASGQIRARGNMRKQVCYLPPVKIDLKKRDLKKYGDFSTDNLKLVLPCKDYKSQYEKLYQEFFLYQLYALIDTNHIKATMIDIRIYNEKDKLDYDFIGLLVEDENSYASRKDGLLLGSAGRIHSGGLEREDFLKMYFFQYMIGNTDWAVINRHNLLLVKLPQKQRLIALPYDYDYSGFVDQSYAVPHESIPIKRVTERHFMPYEMNEAEFYEMVKYFTGMEAEIMAFCDKPTYLSPSSIERNKKYLKEFFNKLKSPEKLVKSIHR